MSNGTVGGLSSKEMETVSDQAVVDLRGLLRMPTINPPGGEGPAIEFIKSRLDEAGVESVVLDCDGRPNLVARVEGTGEAGGPILLAGHVDVVPVEEAEWDSDPFAAEIRDGYLYGRGAVDMKNMVTMCMHVAMLAARAERKPNRDIILAVVSDEEQGCHHGSRFLVEEHPKLVQAEYMIGEVGGYSLDVNGVRYYPIQTAEKGIARIRLTAHGEPGHGSIPHGDMAVVKLSRAIAMLSETRLPTHKTATVERFIKGLAKEQKFPAKSILPLVLSPLFSNLVLNKLLPDRSTADTFKATLSNTVSPTMLSGSEAINVIPGAASAMLDGRLIPGQTAADLLSELRAVVGDEHSLEVIDWAPGRENETGDPLFEAICDNVRRHDPTGVPVPYMIPGFTDAAYFGRLGMTCYGYSPLRFPPDADINFKALFHGHNECLHVEGFKWGMACLWDLIARFTGMAS